MSDITIGEKVRHYRNKAKKSQRNIKFETDIPQTTLSCWERDQCEPTASDIVKLATALGVTVNELLGEPGGPAENGVRVKR